MGRKVVGLILRAPPSKKIAEGVMTNPGMGEASVYHALVVIFLEFFAWGLLTSPMITVLNEVSQLFVYIFTKNIIVYIPCRLSLMRDTVTTSLKLRRSFWINALARWRY